MLEIIMFIVKLAIGAYLGSVVISGTTQSLIVYSLIKRLEREGYKAIEGKISFVEKIVSFLFVSQYWLAPFKNISYTKKMLQNIESVYPQFKEEQLAEAKLELIEQKEILEEPEEQTKKIDTYISNIQKDILEIASIQYEGFEQDIETLYKLASNFLEARKNNTEYEIISSSNEWWNPVTEIELKLLGKRKQATPIKKDANRELLEQTMEYLKQEKIYIAQNKEETVEPMDSGRKL